MVFTPLVFMSTLVALVGIMVIAPAFYRGSRGDYITIIGIGVVIWAVQGGFLIANKEMKIMEAALRAFAIALSSTATGYLYAHFCLHKRRFRDLFRQF